MNELNITLDSLNDNRVSVSELNKSGYTDEYFDKIEKE
jgi:hypothetical protein